MTDYKATLNLPKTAFAMKADLVTREPEILRLWASLRLYERIQQARAGRPPFILHDGPPYANGDIHIGHALNKILKDVIVRYKAMRNFASPYVPGWDCHGMPIEHQLFKELGITKSQISQVDFRTQAKAYAKRYVDIQGEQFKRLGVLGDWDHPYLTMEKAYELTIIRVFKELVKRGLVYWGKKPVYWCLNCETALAEAEVEYETKRSPSVYVSFPVKSVPGKALEGVEALVWTTTPWTLPGNMALAFHPSGEYVLMEVKWQGKRRRLLIARRCAETEFRAHVTNWETLGDTAIEGSHLEGAVFRHPFLDRDVKGVVDEGVSLEEGTGVVHIAPGHGEEDYAIGQRYRLPVLSPVDEQGRFTEEVGLPEFVGANVTTKDTNDRIRKSLELVDRYHDLPDKEKELDHEYPHCWRCKQPVIFRATPQWFLRVDDALRAQLLAAVKQVRWIPEAGLGRIEGMLEHRPDWCLSRQRYWGTPIPVLHCLTCQEPILDAASIERIERRFAQDGTDIWFTAQAEDLLPGGCPQCGGKQLRKETDILDVWFDSGVSHEAVLKSRQELRWPASLYLEGSDQHRGWFQVSLIPAVALRGRPPYEQVLTHGFVVDGEGRKMSKSLGNVIAPQEVIDRCGAEILRLWVASCDYREDVRISEAILEQVVEAYRKIRNTFRYLLANLYDFLPSRDRQPVEVMPELDRWALQQTQQLLETVTDAYEAYQFHQAFRAIYQFCVLDLSAFYLDSLKDRLYTEAADAPKRRCAQTALYDILVVLVKLLAPMLAMTTEEVWQAMRKSALIEEPSVHLALWPTTLVQTVEKEFTGRWEMFFHVRDLVMKALEDQRSADVIGSPLEARVTLAVTDVALERLFAQHRQTLAETCVVSEVCVVNAKTAGIASPREPSSVVPGLAQVKVERSPGAKCQRCWKYTLTVGMSADHPQLCERCVGVLKKMMGDG